jgi:hypothetical protein
MLTEKHKKNISIGCKRAGAGKWMLGRSLSIQHKQNIGRSLKGIMKGKKLSPEHIEKLRKSHLGKKPAPLTPEGLRKLREIRKGSKSNLWKGGLTDQNKILRSSSYWKEWRKAVYERDNYTCQECKIRGGKLHPHHIKPFAKFPELRFEISNGITLCEMCHRKTDSYGRPNKKIKQ